MTPLALTPPALEPVSLDEARLYLRLDRTDEDDLLATLITAARLMVEAASGRMLIAQHWRLVLDTWPGCGTLRLPLAPLIAVTAARVFDAAGLATALAPAAFVPIQGSDPPLLRLGPELPAPGRAFAGIEIDLEIGFGPAPADVPASLRQAVLLLAARWFEHRSDAVERDAQALPASILALVAPHRRARL